MINYAMLKLPLPFNAPEMNAYLIKNDPVTLIDCGVYSNDNKLALKEQLGCHGLELTDIKRILLTHSHVDHFGMAAEIQRISQCPVFLHSSEQYRARDYSGFNKSLYAYCCYVGLPADMHIKLRDYNKWVAGFSLDFEEIVSVEDRDIFTFYGFELEAILTPGHSAGHICFFEKDQGLLFCGDALLGKPSPALEFTQIGTLDRRKTLIEYANSIDRLKTVEINLILPGHGNPFQDAEALLGRLSRQHQKRKNIVCQNAANLKVFDPFTLVRQLYEELTVPVNCSSAIGEVLGYLDILEAEGTVRQHQNKPGLVYTFNR